LSGSTIFLGNVKLSESEAGTLKIVDAEENEVIVGEEIDGRLDSLEIESGSIRSALNNYTSSADNRLGNLETESGSIRTTLNNFTSSADNRLGAIEVESGSIRTTLNNFTSSIETALTISSSNVVIEGNLAVSGGIAYDNNISGLTSSTVQDAIDELSNKPTSAVQYFTASFTTASWNAGDSFEYIATSSIVGLLDTDRPLVALDLSSVGLLEIADVAVEFQTVYRVEASDDDELTLYATSIPTVDFDLLIQVVR
jgi:hypothetical protein